MAVRIKLDKAKISKLTEAQIQALEMTAEAVLSQIISDQVVPKQEGILERGGEIEIGSKKAGTLRVITVKSGYVDKDKIDQGKAAIVFNTPYARRLYYHPEYNFRKDKNPNAQGRWMDMYLPGGEKETYAQDAFTKFLKQLAGGIIK